MRRRGGFSLVHAALQVVFGLQSAQRVVEVVVPQALHERLLEGLTLSWGNRHIVNKYLAVLLFIFKYTFLILNKCCFRKGP